MHLLWYYYNVQFVIKCKLFKSVSSPNWERSFTFLFFFLWNPYLSIFFFPSLLLESWQTLFFLPLSSSSLPFSLLFFSANPSVNFLFCRLPFLFSTLFLCKSILAAKPNGYPQKNSWWVFSFTFSIQF